MAYFRVNHRGFQSLKEQGVAKSDRAIAQLLQVDPATMSRVLRGKTEPTGRLVAGAVAALGPSWLGILFDVVEEK
ncbi:hypothetical protein LITTLEE_96 [Mycobacterium phage LittleE]|uniref:Uncharacterized protein n=4 Tax=Omegavirus TaxID=1623292 RepID=Q854G5_BPMOM|nr:HTH DNA binding protein [Mycobacterium phage Omega]YP_009011987.1 HTH DNA binding protein [Mycobacterium phage Courthouse]YP_009205222.1 HTH DNA binding protein [Mycobacterium phage Ariel]YP_009213310.1 HTH DNA binding protein [Mycobacterium phage MiaZeal]YP_009637007.1 HTH DNA binding protein [Mycobacterium phage LittleE]ASD50721.1 helix-turn-helix DNA binding protein [Mycobacterium phage Porcelain]ASD53483.1 helix-turn-helix DNA binding protein [Mycobacterium phage Lucky2013]ASZ74167.1 